MHIYSFYALYSFIIPSYYSFLPLVYFTHVCHACIFAHFHIAIPMPPLMSAANFGNMHCHLLYWAAASPPSLPYLAFVHVPRHCTLSFCLACMDHHTIYHATPPPVLLWFMKTGIDIASVHAPFLNCVSPFSFLFSY